MRYQLNKLRFVGEHISIMADGHCLSRVDRSGMIRINAFDCSSAGQYTVPAMHGH